MGFRTIVANWPRVGTGNHALAITGPFGRYEQTVQIRPSKITAAGVERLLDDLQSRLPASIAMTAAEGTA